MELAICLDYNQYIGGFKVKCSSGKFDEKNGAQIWPSI